MGNVEVPHDEELATLLGGASTGCREMTGETGKEALLASLLVHRGLVLRIWGGTLGQVQTGECDWSLGEVYLDVATLLGEWVQGAGQSRSRAIGLLGVTVGCHGHQVRTPGAYCSRLLAGEQRHAIASGPAARLPGDVIAGEDSCWQIGWPASHLLQAQDVWAAVGDPRLETSALRGANPVDVERCNAHDIHCA